MLLQLSTEFVQTHESSSGVRERHIPRLLASKPIKLVLEQCPSSTSSHQSHNGQLSCWHRGPSECRNSASSGRALRARTRHCPRQARPGGTVRRTRRANSAHNRAGHRTRASCWWCSGRWRSSRRARDWNLRRGLLILLQRLIRAAGVLVDDHRHALLTMRHLTTEDPDWLGVVDNEVVHGSELSVCCHWNEAGTLTWASWGCQVCGHGHAGGGKGRFSYGVVLGVC